MGRELERFYRKVQKAGPDECWIWIGAIGTGGYGYFRAYGPVVKASRFAYQTFIGPIPPGMDVCHACDVPACVNPAHLWAGTTSENVLDMFAKGRAPKRPRGYKRPDNAERNRRLGKLKAEQVIEIRSSAETNRALGRKFGVSEWVVGLARRGKTYKGL